MDLETVRLNLNELVRNTLVPTHIPDNNLFFDNEVVFDQDGNVKAPSVGQGSWVLSYIRGTGAIKDEIGIGGNITFTAQLICELRTPAGDGGMQTNDRICQPLIDALMSFDSEILIENAFVQEASNNGIHNLSLIVSNFRYYRFIEATL